MKNYIINITFIVEPPAHADWYEFFTKKFLPYVREDQSYGKTIFTRVLTDDKNPHYTYSLQVCDSSIEDYQRFIATAMAEYSSIAAPWFAEKVLHYPSLLKIIK